MGNLLGDGGSADADLVLAGFVGAGGIDDEVDLAVFHHVDDVGAGLLGKFVNAGAGDAFGGEAGVGAAGRVDLETQIHQIAGNGDGAVLVEIGDG